jgi:hypothetical protein
MERYIHNENIRRYRKLLAEEEDEEKRDVIRKLLAEEEPRIYRPARRTGATNQSIRKVRGRLSWRPVSFIPN